jgi:hypothetical protein
VPRLSRAAPAGLIACLRKIKSKTVINKGHTNDWSSGMGGYNFSSVLEIKCIIIKSPPNATLRRLAWSEAEGQSA